MTTVNATTANATTARKLARQLWGEVQQQTKLADGIWEYQTAGHGGIIVDNDVYPVMKKWNTPVSIKVNSRYGYSNEQHFSAFEEDAEWAIVGYLLYDKIVNKKNYKRYMKTCERYHTSNKRTYEDWSAWYTTCILKTMKKYFHKIMEDETLISEYAFKLC